MERPEPSTVLVVDDDHDIRDLLKDLLERDGFEVECVETAAAAIDYLDDHVAPCAMLVDMLMPGIVGSSLLEYVRRDRRFANVPIAVVSGSPQLAPTGYRVFEKPIDIDRVLAFLRAGCPRRQPTSKGA